MIADSGVADVRYLEQGKLGLSASRNLALASANGELLAVTDDDCAPDQGWVAGLIAAFQDASQPVAVTGPIRAFEGVPPPGMYAISLREAEHARIFAVRAIPWMVGSGGNFAARVPDLRQIGGWDERLGVGTPGQAAEDCELIDRIFLAGGTIYYTPDAVVRHAWQTRDRRKSTRWSYGFGIGALCGIRAADRDTYAAKMVASYAGLHLPALARAAARLNWDQASERLAALGALVPGCIYGFRVGARPNVSLTWE